MISDFIPEGYRPHDHQKQFVTGFLNFRKAGIDIEELEWDELDLAEGWVPGLARKVKISQNRLLNGYVLNQKQLVERAKELYKLLGRDVKVIPVVWRLDTSDITVGWIREKMEEFGLKRNDLIAQLAFEKSYLSRLLSGDIGLSNSAKAKFFWYFMGYELNRDLRRQISLDRH